VSAHQFPPHPLTIVYLDHLAVVAEPAEAPKCKRSEKHLVSFLGFPLSCTPEGSATQFGANSCPSALPSRFPALRKALQLNSELILPKRTTFPLSCTSEGSATANTVVEVLRVGFSDYVAGETTFKPICVLVY